MKKDHTTKNTSLRRKFMTGLAIAGAGVLLAGCSAAGPAVDIDLGSGPAEVGTVKANALDGVTLTFVSWGGTFQEGQMEAAGKPFAEESGATVLEDGPTEYAKVKAQVDNNAVTWDVVDTDIIWAQMQCGEHGLLHASAAEAGAGQAAVPVTVRQAIYLGSGWKYEIVLPDGGTGVVRGSEQLPWLSGDNAEAWLSWRPTLASQFAL